jgi:hypothetical protein
MNSRTIIGVTVLATGCSVGAGASGGASLQPGMHPPAMARCVVTGDTRVLAGRARIRGGLEAVAFDNRLAVGYAVDAAHGVALELAPTSLAIIAASKKESQDPIRHTTPVASTGSWIGCATDADSGKDSVSGARTVSGSAAFVVGSANGHLVWSESSTGEVHELWTIGAQAIESLRVNSLGAGKGFVTGFRQGDHVRLGSLLDDKTAGGPLSPLPHPMCWEASRSRPATASSWLLGRVERPGIGAPRSIGPDGFQGRSRRHLARSRNDRTASHLRRHSPASGAAPFFSRTRVSRAAIRVSSRK